MRVVDGLVRVVCGTVRDGVDGGLRARARTREGWIPMVVVEALLRTRRSAGSIAHRWGRGRSSQLVRGVAVRGFRGRGRGSLVELASDLLHVVS